MAGERRGRSLPVPYRPIGNRNGRRPSDEVDGILGPTEEEDAAKEVASSLRSIPVAFWCLGLLNNASFVIMVASAKSISEGGTALVFLANTVPALTVKLSAPYWFDKVSYNRRLLVSAILMAACFVVVAMAQQVQGELLGVAFASTQCGMGEATLLALAGRWDATLASLQQQQQQQQDQTNNHDPQQRQSRKKGGRCLTSFSSGTGLAGVFGFLWKWFLNDFLHFSLDTTLLMAISLAFFYALVYRRYLYRNEGLEHHHQQLAAVSSALDDEEQRTEPPTSDDGSTSSDEKRYDPNTNVSMIAMKELRHRHTGHDQDEVESSSELHDDELQPVTSSYHDSVEQWDDELHSNEASSDEQQLQEEGSRIAHVKHVQDMTTLERFRLVLSLYPYMIPLFVVYVAEYALQAGTWTAIGFPVTSVHARDEFYEYSNWMYQIGVFFSRSSGTLYTAPMSILWLMPALQCINVVFFGWVAVQHVWNNYTLLIPCLYVGLLGGAVYISGYQRICFDLPLEHREFALSSVSVAESVGIVAADVAGLYLQSCLYRANGIQGAVVSCPLPAS